MVNKGQIFDKISMKIIQLSWQKWIKKLYIKPIKYKLPFICEPKAHFVPQIIHKPFSQMFLLAIKDFKFKYLIK